MSSSHHEPIADPELGEVASRLERERLMPSAEFRSDLHERLMTPPAPRRIAWRPRALVTAYAGSGTLLLMVAAIGLAGVGPFAA